jgi:hypothetical protein
MTPLSESSAPVRLLTAIIVALAVVLGLLYLGLSIFSSLHPSASSGISAEEQRKLDVLASLKSDTSVTDPQKQATLQTLGSGAGQVSDQQKLDVLNSLQTQ